MITRMTLFEKTHLIRFQIIRKNAFDPPIAIMFSYWLKNGWVINIFSWGGSNVFFRRVVIHVVNFSERNLAGSKVFSHAPASRDYIGLLDQKWYPRVPAVHGFLIDEVIDVPFAAQPLCPFFPWAPFPCYHFLPFFAALFFGILKFFYFFHLFFEKIFPKIPRS